MPVHILGYESTPNPNALKCRLDQSLSDVPRSFLNASMAEEDALATALFAGAPITTILINGDWMTINKRPDADWRAVKSRIERILTAMDAGASP